MEDSVLEPQAEVETSDRDKLAQTLDDTNSFVRLVQESKGSSANFNLQDALMSLSPQDTDQFWSKWQLLVAQSALALFQVSHDQSELSAGGADHVVLRSAAFLCESNLTLPGMGQDMERAVPDGLRKTVSVLHSVLPSLKNKSLSNEIVHLCETWYLKNMPDRDSVIANAITELLKKALSENGAKSDIKRLLKVQDGLHIFCLSDRSSENLKSLLLKASQTSLFWKSTEGMKFLSFLFTLSSDFVRYLHASIKEVIPGANKTKATAYGEIYFKAWRQASEDVRANIEETCLQDLMSHLILANRKLEKKRCIFEPMLTVIGKFHLTRNDRQCQTMLVRLWEPLLWRHTRVANPMVRQNAAEIFFNAFPLENMDATMEERSLQMDKQYKLMLQFLSDECPEVRIASINGMCCTIILYWVIIPLDILNQSIKLLVKDLAFDASSFKVRLAVIKGLQLMLSCDRAHLFLKNILPKISDCLHDVNESVRIAMVDLLIAVKSVKTIQYWNVCSLDDLLARLQVDTPSVNKRIVNLLFNSFFPTDKSEDSKIERCIFLIKNNRKASRKFYEHGEKLMSIHDCVKFLLAILLSVKRHAKGELDKTDVLSEHASDGEDKENTNQLKKRTANKRRKLLGTSNSTLEESVNESSNRTGSVLSESNATSVMTDNTENTEVGDTTDFENPSVVAGLLDIACLIWTVRSKEISEKVEYNALLEKKASKILSSIFKFYKSSEVIGPIVFLCSLLPHSSVTNVSSFCLSRLKSIDTSNADTDLDYQKVEGLTIYADALCRWKRGDDLLETITDWLRFDDVNRNSKCQKGVRFAESANVSRPELALMLVQYLFQHPMNRAILLNKNRTHIEELTDVLVEMIPKLSSKLSHPEENEPMSEVEQRKWLLAWESILKLTVIKCKRESEESKSGTLSRIEDCMEWVEKRVFPNSEVMAHPLADKLVSFLVKICSNIITLGVCDVNFIGHCTEFCFSYLTKVENLASIQESVHLCLQMSNWIKVYCKKFPDSHLVQDVALPMLLEGILDNLAKSDQLAEDEKELKVKLGQILDTMASVKNSKGISKTVTKLISELTSSIKEQGFPAVRTEIPLPLTHLVMSLVVAKSRLLQSFVDSLVAFVEDNPEIHVVASFILLVELILSESNHKNIKHIISEILNDLSPERLLSSGRPNEEDEDLELAEACQAAINTLRRDLPILNV